MSTTTTTAKPRRSTRARHPREASPDDAAAAAGAASRSAPLRARAGSSASRSPAKAKPAPAPSLNGAAAARRAHHHADYHKRESDNLRLLVCFVGINAFYLLYGWIQEELTRADARGEKLDNTLFLFGAQALTNSVFAGAMRAAVRGRAPSKPLSSAAESVPLVGERVSGWAWLAFVSASYMSAMLCSHQALQYVSYPLQALAKSSKLVPVMLGNVLVGVPLERREVLMVLAITAGILVFQYEAKPGSTRESSVYGYAFLALSLCLDGVTGSHQHLLDREFRVSTYDLMFYMNAFSFAMLLVPLALTGDGARGLAYVASHPDALRNVLGFGLCSALGQSFVFYTITGPGPLACTTITTTRKFFTILISVVLHPDNRLRPEQWVGVALVFSAVAAEVYQRARGHAAGEKSKGGKRE